MTIADVYQSTDEGMLIGRRTLKMFVEDSDGRRFSKFLDSILVGIRISWFNPVNLTLILCRLNKQYALIRRGRLL